MTGSFLKFITFEHGKPKKPPLGTRSFVAIWQLSEVRLMETSSDSHCERRFLIQKRLLLIKENSHQAEDYEFEMQMMQRIRKRERDSNLTRRKNYYGSYKAESKQVFPHAPNPIVFLANDEWGTERKYGTNFFSIISRSDKMLTALSTNATTILTPIEICTVNGFFASFQTSRRRYLYVAMCHCHI